MSTISVIIPAYNMELYLAECLKSIIKQDDLPDEIIVIDDGSTDSTSTIVELFERECTAIKYIKQKNGGLCSARNTGLRIATSDYVIFLDSDDCLGKGTIKKCRTIIDTHQPDIIIGRSELFTDMKRWIPESYEKICDRDRITTFSNEPQLVNCISVSSKCFNRNFLKKTGVFFYEGVMMTEDHWFSLMTFSLSNKIFITRQIMFSYRRNRLGASTVTNRLSYYTDMYKVQKALSKSNIKNLKEYYKRLTNYELLVYGTRPILELPSDQEQLQAAKILKEILGILPTDIVRNSHNDLVSVYKSPEDFIKKKRLLKFLSKFNIIRKRLSLQTLAYENLRLNYKSAKNLIKKLLEYRGIICFVCFLLKGI